MKFFLNEKVNLLLILLVLVFLSIRISDRANFFQECDSTFIYDSTNNFPNSAMLFVAGTLRNENTYFKMSKELAERIVESRPVDSLIKVVLKDYPKEQLVKALSAGDKPPLFFIRGALIAGLMDINEYLPYSLKMGFHIALSSTYSFGTGVIYGLFAPINSSYSDFINNSLISTLVIFHLSIICLYFILKNVGVSPVASAITSLMALFSISLSSYSFHLGSTIWNFSTCVIFIYTLIICREKYSENYLKYISWISVVLILFSYMIVILWTCVIIAHFLNLNAHSPKIINRFSIIKIIKSQIPALVMFAIVYLLFFPPGQQRGGDVSSLMEVGKNLYFIVLNFFSIYNKNTYIDMTQFCVSIIFLFFGIKSCFDNFSIQKNAFMRKYLLVVWSVVAIIFILGNFNIGPSFGPSRHILFAASFIFIFYGLGLEFIIEKFKLRTTGRYALLTVVIFLGVGSVFARLNDANDKTEFIRVRTDVTNVIIEGCHYHLLHKNWGANVSAKINDMSGNQVLIKGGTYLYITQDLQSPIQENLWTWKSKGYSLEILDNQAIATGVQFLAYSPNQFAWDRQSGFEAVTFKVNSQ